MDEKQRHAIWMAMAEQFLDTERRQDIPRIAVLCLEAGLNERQAARIWRREVAPVLYGNLLSVAGEWAGWSDDWLFARIEKHRANSWGPISWIADVLRSLIGNCYLRATIRCMRAISAADEPPS